MNSCERNKLIPKKDWLKIRQEAFRLFREQKNQELCHSTDITETLYQNNRRNWDKAFEKYERRNMGDCDEPPK